MHYAITCPSPIGPLTIASDGQAIVGLWIQGQRYFAAGFSAFCPGDGIPVLAAAQTWLAQYFAGARPDPGQLPLRPAGTPFRLAVWEVLRQIPYGTTVTYGAVAQEAAAKLGRATASSRAAGNAVGHNPISILIPCHRVVGADGRLTGYAGGLPAKEWLLTLEGVSLSNSRI